MFSDMYVVFTNDEGNWWSNFLHPKIKHCYVIVPSQGSWIVHSKTTGKFDLFNACNINGIIEPNSIVIGCKQRPGSRSLLIINTCVGHTKQLLGINKPFILTPHQLYKHLRKYHGNETKST